MTTTLGKKTPLTVPDRVCRRAGFKPGDKVEFTASPGVVTIVPRRKGVQADIEMLTPREAKKLRTALRQVHHGKTTPWRQVKHDLGL
jgi:bifunctional DNA-binding transcriptional regulator/antitoxin component of YhaV-PrlF toxin-antitoxin module